MTDHLRIRSISKTFRGASQAALRDVTLSAREGELLALVGASGSGKSTLLRIVAGLEGADHGEVRLGGETLTRGDRILVPPERRRVGLVFQNHALFPHLTVRRNVAFGLPRGRAETGNVDRLLALVGLEKLGMRYPHELSGGEAQRVALVRAMAPEPTLLLLDEPFSSLDPALREQLQGETLALIRKQETTALWITHDSREALALADRIAVMRDGTLLQVDTPATLYRRPNSRHVASAFGPCNFIKRDSLEGFGSTPDTRGIEPGERAARELWLRPEQLRLCPPGAQSKLASGVVAEIRFFGDCTSAVVECGDTRGTRFTVMARGTEGRSVDVGQAVDLMLA